VKKIYCLCLFCILFTACKNLQRERLTELQDAANVWNIYNTNIAVIQSSVFYSTAAMRPNLPGFCAYNIARMDSLDGLIFKNDTLRKLAKRYINSTREYLRIVQDSKSENWQVKAYLLDVSLDVDALMKYAKKRYALNRFTALREENYYREIEKNQYWNKQDLAKVNEMPNYPWRSKAEAIKKVAEHATDANQRAVAWIRYADFYEQNRNNFKAGEDTVALGVYAELAFSKEYHLYKYEAWRKWRCLYQMIHFGATTNAFIFNKYYDNMRFIALQAISKQLSVDPSDALAMNEYFLLATHGPILRYGDYNGGNQVVMEMSELFDVELNMQPKENLKKEIKPHRKHRKHKKRKHLKKHRHHTH
jgi:hypothetical protein